MTEERMRKEFEEWITTGNHNAFDRSGDGYRNMTIQLYWEAWQACAKLKDERIKELESLLEVDTDEGTHMSYMSYADLKAENAKWEDMYRTSQERIKELEAQIPVWQPIETAPKNGVKIMLTYKNSLNKYRAIFGCYIPKFTEESCEEGAEYDEKTDEYYTPEGWYECMDNWDDYSHIRITEGEPTHWMLLPQPPKEN